MITILRLGHRIFRDQRITTHCALAGRALGAGQMIYTGQRDQETEQSVSKVVSQWGGSFRIRHSDSWKRELASFNGIKVHLTVYGMPFQDEMPEIHKACRTGKNGNRTKNKGLMIIVGGEKVPPDVYEMADFNVSVTSQPHSEVAGLALFLHEFFQGRELARKFPNASLRVVPQERGKKTIKRSEKPAKKP